MTVRLLVLVPTRNRADLARRAVSSVLKANDPRIEIVVSDNSTDSAQAEALRLFCAEQLPVTYLRPPQDFAMALHWEWALGECLQRPGVTHLTVLTDRLVYRDGALARVCDFSQKHPDEVLTYNLDRINDLQSPVMLERQRWSGGLYRFSTARLLELSARCVFHTCVPRLMNCVAPLAALRAVRQRFGNYCISVSPDFAFANRYMALYPTLLYWDRALVVGHSLHKSNGASITRGTLSKDGADFRSRLGGAAPFPSTPYPEMYTGGNAVLEEYCAVQAVCKELPPVDMGAYVKMLYRDIQALEDPQGRAQQLELLRKRGHGALLVARRAGEILKRAGRRAEGAVKRVFRPDRLPPPPLGFADIDAALDYDRDHPAHQLQGSAHLKLWQPERVIDT